MLEIYETQFRSKQSIDNLLAELLLRAKPLHTLVLIAAILISQAGPIILVAAGPLLVRRTTFGRGAVARAADAEIPTPGLAVGWPRQRDITITPGSCLP